jgi:hypothetical protein
MRGLVRRVVRGIHSYNGFARFHHVEFISRQKFDVVWVVLEKTQLAALLVVFRFLLIDLLFERIESPLLPLLFLNQRQKPTGENDENRYNTQYVKDTV